MSSIVGISYSTNLIHDNSEPIQLTFHFESYQPFLTTHRLLNRPILSNVLEFDFAFATIEESILTDGNCNADKFYNSIDLNLSSISPLLNDLPPPVPFR